MLFDTNVVAAGQLTVVVGSTPEILTEVAFGRAKVFAAVLAFPSVNPEKSTAVMVTPPVSIKMFPATLLRVALINRHLG